MKEIKVLRLSGCDWCKALVNKLKEHSISFSEIDVNENGSLADELEAYLKTTYYPIVIIDSEDQVTYLYRPIKAEEVGHHTLGPDMLKIGCLTVEAMLTQILNN
jgi:glutaredoxin